MRRLIITDGCMLTILQVKPVEARHVAKSRVIRRVGRIIDAVALDFQAINIVDAERSG